MQPEFHINYLAIGAAILANIAIGFLWYGPLFGKAWMKEIGLSPDKKPEPKGMTRAMILMVIGAFLMAFVLAHSIEVWRPSTWKVGPDSSGVVYGLSGGIWTWVGFVVPLLFGGVAWEGKSWKLFGINAGYWLVALVAMGLILALWR